MIKGWAARCRSSYLERASYKPNPGFGHAAPLYNLQGFGKEKGVRIMSRITSTRVDVAFIRKSTPAQDVSGQIANVQTMLRELGVYLPERSWFVGTVSRRKLKSNAEFNRLMQLVEADKIGTVYVESQDRWGSKDRKELFSLLYTLEQHGTRLYDLKEKKDLTEKDLATELLTIVNSIKSEKELDDIAYRSIRTRVNNFKDNGSWPTGTHPYGYGKRCFGPDERLLWEWIPVDRSSGQVFYPDASGNLQPGPDNIRIPQKTNRDRTILVPGRPEYVRAVKLIFDLFSRVGYSRRKISAMLNAEGYLFNGGPFTHPDIRNILTNPAYLGDTYFGKVQTGEIHSFDATGRITEVKGKRDQIHRDLADCIVRKGTHEALVGKEVWELAQNKLQSESERTSYSPRNPAYYLKQLFVCGHCGRGMCGRTEVDKSSRRRTVVYVCSSYSAGMSNGHSSPCGYQRITHEQAEQLLLDKINEQNLAFDSTASEDARASLAQRLANLGHEDEASREKWWGWLREGVGALLDYLKESGIDDQKLRKLEKRAMFFYRWGKLTADQFADLPVALADFKAAVQEVEEIEVERARQKVAELTEEHKTYTKAWAKASDLQQGVLKEEIDRLEQEILAWKPRTMSLTLRLNILTAAEAERQAERQKLLAEWPALECREKGEALRRLFSKVTLFWDRQFCPASKKPTRPRKTSRPGRYSYTLQTDRIQWAFAASDLENSW